MLLFMHKVMISAFHCTELDRLIWIQHSDMPIPKVGVQSISVPGVEKHFDYRTGSQCCVCCRLNNTLGTGSLCFERLGLFFALGASQVLKPSSTVEGKEGPTFDRL